MSLPLGTPVPLNVQLPDENGSLHVRATVLDSANAPISGSPFTLPYIEMGSYGVSTLLMPDNAWIKAIYEVFTDSGFTTLSTVYGNSIDIFYLEVASTGGGAALNPTLLGEIVRDCTVNVNACAATQTPIPIVQNADTTFDIRFLDYVTKDPFDLTGVSSIVASFLNTDGTILNLPLGSGVSIVSPAVIGKINIAISAAQTALMQYGIVSFKVTIVKSSLTHIVQFPYLLNVAESVFA